MSRSLMLPEEVDAILNIIPERGIVLEIGTFHGLTVSKWASMRPDVVFFSIDPLRSKQAGLEWYVNRLPNMRLLTGTIDDLLILQATVLFDVIVVDGDHDYIPCYHDLEVGCTLLKPGRMFAVHDYAKGTLRRTTARAVVRSIRDFCQKYHYTIDHVIGTTAFLKQVQQ